MADCRHNTASRYSMHKATDWKSEAFFRTDGSSWLSRARIRVYGFRREDAPFFKAASSSSLLQGTINGKPIHEDDSRFSTYGASSYIRWNASSQISFQSDW